MKPVYANYYEWCHRSKRCIE